MCLLLYGPVQRVKAKNTEFVIKGTVATTLEQELCKLGDMMAKQWNFLIVSDNDKSDNLE